ncbi:hypothetical protein K439DRAFT_1650065 [Ramaria rubella]|nr:hypothetical protein K439DRAFT_1650065 [Ramaria rubella]
MLGARDLYTISKQLCYALNCHTEAFGGMNIILAGDFAQLPPISQYTLYSGSIGTKKLQGVTNEIQEATIGKAAWHQFTTVACTTADISFLKTLVGGQPANKVKLNQAKFHNISVIVGPNAHNDKYNMLGSDCYANDTRKPLHHFYSLDPLGSPKLNEDNQRKRSRARMKDPRRASNTLSPELQHVVWNLPHEASQHCAGKLSICHGMPGLVKHNIATPCCVTNGVEGTVVGWKSSKLTKDKNVLDILFVKLKNPPLPIHIDGLPVNVVPISRTAQDVVCHLPNDDTLTIIRQRVQGRTRPNNVVDLGGCLTHQSYYTCLSRSASAGGTVILQHFEPNKIAGGASGWLRQEYERKLPKDVIGDRRNTIIREYQLLKGINFVPKHVHAALH